MLVRAVITYIAVAGCISAAYATENAEPTPGQFRPDPLEPVRVYTYPDDYEEYYGGAEPGLKFTFEVNDTDAAFEVGSSLYWWTDEESPPRLYPNFVSAYKGYGGKPRVRCILPSLELIGQRGKVFDDGALAAAEFRLDEGTPALPGGRYFRNIGRFLLPRFPFGLREYIERPP